MCQGEAWWADLPEPVGSESGYRRPVVIVQSDGFNRGRLATVVCAPLTTTRCWAGVPGHVLLRSDDSGLPHDSVAQTSQVTTLGRGALLELVGRLPESLLQSILDGLDVVLGR
ncbi:MAG: type II toxin-antitoxin system PemK/MazF family toxin [Armatimonadetes bacterium]|nr:type II toxin-antitoxin system PemK/MazF family toxin [Armatimonadota bacterium]